MAIHLFTPTFRIDECMEAIRECLEKGWTGLGFKTLEIEKAWCDYAGLPHAHFLNSNTSHKDLLELEQKVMNTIHQINTAKRKREFLLEFVEDPVDFINNWIESQSGDLRELLGERAVEAEEIRKAEFFDQPWVNEAVFHYLNVKRQEPVDQFYSKMKPK